jgi:branched-chain amino acid transport system substrate-binding protein
MSATGRLRAAHRRPALLAWLLAAACRGEATPPVAIGYADPYQHGSVAVAREEIASWPTATPAVVLVHDTLEPSTAIGAELARASRLVAVPGLVGIVGHGGSRATLAAAPLYNQAGVVQVAPTSTSRFVRDVGPWTFTLVPDDSVEGAFIGRYAAERLGARRVTIFYHDDEYGDGLRDGVAAELARRGVAVLDAVPYVPASDLRLLVAASLRRGRPDVIVVAGRERETGRIARLAQPQAPGLRFVAGDGALLLPGLAAEAGPAADSIYVVSFWHPDPADSLARAFTRRFTRLTGRLPGPTQALTHDALLLLARAARESGGEPAAMREWLLDLGRGRPPYRGVTGPITFGPDRAPRLHMVRLRNGRVERAP